MTTTTSLKQILAAGQFVSAPGVYDMFSARIADQLDFKALYMTGYGVSGSYLGLADAGLITIPRWWRAPAPSPTASANR
jgi:2-methylisocitrate lyase-like PEP mutase family enzyme